MITPFHFLEEVVIISYLVLADDLNALEFDDDLPMEGIAMYIVGRCRDDCTVPSFTSTFKTFTPA